MNIFNLKDANEEISDKINLDDLYEKKRESDEMKQQLYNRILNRIHERIKITSRQKKNEQFCWYVIPEIMVGIPKYDSHECTSYILEKLHNNGFIVKYTHPNLIFISWQHHVPTYVRNEFKKKTGIIIDDRGNRVDEIKTIEPKNNNELLFNKGSGETSTTEKKSYNSIANYKPSGIYNMDLFESLNNKINK